MGEVDRHLATVEGPDRAAMERVYAVARATVPEAEDGRSYGMAALLYRGKGLVATVRTKRFLSIYPYSGAVLASLADELADFETTSGSLHYTADHQVPEALLRRIVAARRDEIDARGR